MTKFLNIYSFNAIKMCVSQVFLFQIWCGWMFFFLYAWWYAWSSCHTNSSVEIFILKSPHCFWLCHANEPVPRFCIFLTLVGHFSVKHIPLSCIVLTTLLWSVFFFTSNYPITLVYNFIKSQLEHVGGQTVVLVNVVVRHTILDERGPRRSHPNKHREKCIFNKANHTVELILIVKLCRIIGYALNCWKNTDNNIVGHFQVNLREITIADHGNMFYWFLNKILFRN